MAFWPLVWPLTSPVTRTTSPTCVKVRVPLTFDPLRGSSFATPPGVAHPRFRNFYTPERYDMFCGFRTCAL